MERLVQSEFDSGRNIIVAFFGERTFLREAKLFDHSNLAKYQELA